MTFCASLLLTLLWRGYKKPETTTKATCIDCGVHEVLAIQGRLVFIEQNNKLRHAQKSEKAFKTFYWDAFIAILCILRYKCPVQQLGSLMRHCFARLLRFLAVNKCWLMVLIVHKEARLWSNRQVLISALIKAWHVSGTFVDFSMVAILAGSKIVAFRAPLLEVLLNA